MAPEKRYAPSSVFTVRLGFGSVILAAVITFVGLAWIFFLGVMVGRMYYGTDDATSPQKPSIVQENSAQYTETKNNVQNFTNDSAHNKTGTTYQPVLKEDKRLEQINHKPHTFAEDIGTGDDSIESSSTGYQYTTIEAPSYNNTAPTETRSKSVDKNHNVPVKKQNFASDKNDNTTDFIEKVDDNFSEKVRKRNGTSKQTIAPSETPSPTTLNEKLHGTELLQNTGSISTLKDKDIYSELVIKASTDKQNVSKKVMTPQISQRSDKANDFNNTKERRYQYTYQLATFQNAGNADATVKKLCADGINASLLQEEKDGSIMYYILVHDTGTESAQKQLLEKFAQHHFTKFITRRSAIQE